MNLDKGHIDHLIFGVANATNALIAEKLEVGMKLALEALAKPLKVSAGVIYVNHQDSKGDFLTSARYFWSNQILDGRGARNQNIDETVLKDVLPVLLKGDSYEMRFSDSTEAFRSHMGLDGTKSVILFPVNVEGMFWGILALIDFEQERNWTVAEKLLLLSFANSIGNAVCRNRLEDNLEHLVEERTIQLENSRKRFQLAVEGSQDGIWDWQPKEGKAYWSPRMYEQLGFEADEFPAPEENFFDMVHPSDAAEAINRFNNHLNDKTPYEVEFRLKTKSGKYRWFKSTGQAQWDEDGLPVRVVGSHEDIHDRKEAEMALKETHRRMDDLVNNLPGMVYRCLNDQKWSMEYISAACKVITGYDAEAFYGMSSSVAFGDLIHSDDQADVWEQVQRCVRNKESFRVVYRIINREGKEKWLWEQGNGVFGENGELDALEGCIFDISPMVKNHEEQSQAIYNAENEERKRIASDLHDGLQQTLGVSALNLQYLDDEIENLSRSCQERFEKSKEFLEKGIKESRSIAHRVMPKSIEKMGLDKALQDLVSELQEASGIACNYYCNLRGRLDSKIEIGLFRIVQEALNNVWKSSKAKHVNVQLIRIEEGVQLMVEDDGVGFDKNKLDFYKTGFGLTSMKSRISALSGNLTIDSTPDHGTSVIALIPIID